MTAIGRRNLHASKLVSRNQAKVCRAVTGEYFIEPVDGAARTNFAQEGGPWERLRHMIPLLPGIRLRFAYDVEAVVELV
jgi:hypothetical protein